MIYREVSQDDKVAYNNIVKHPLQSWQWGEFREKTGVRVVRCGLYDGKKLVSGFQLTIHRLPLVSYTIGYLPKGPMPNEEMLKELMVVGKEHRCIFLKLEPNAEVLNHELRIGRYRLKQSPHPLFTKYTFQLNLTKSEDELLGQMNSKTRYNLRLAQKKGVVVEEDNSDSAFAEYLRLTFETTKRQSFFAHDEAYHRLMWQILHPVGMAHLLTAKYQGKILVTWIVFLFNNILYYPYGASSSEHRDVMASNLMMWGAMRWGKEHGAKVFDLWGSLGPNPDPKDSWSGFHRFKEGYGPRHVEFMGSFDLVLNSLFYRVYNTMNMMRWLALKLAR